MVWMSWIARLGVLLGLRLPATGKNANLDFKWNIPKGCAKTDK